MNQCNFQEGVRVWIKPLLLYTRAVNQENQKEGQVPDTQLLAWDLSFFNWNEKSYSLQVSASKLLGD